MVLPYMSSKKDVVSVVVPVYRSGVRALAAAASMLEQTLPPGMEIEILLVDDGSDDDTPMLLSQRTDDRIKVLRLPRNQGRSAARNAGASQACGERLLFMDCDCLPGKNGLIANHLSIWEPDVVATIGPVTGDGNGFWHRYQSAASERRARQHAAGIHFSGSSQNMMVSRAAFEACDGFDDSYRTYGFEDRDLQIRLARYGRIVWAPAASVRHLDALTLPLVCQKMAEAAGPSAVLFSRNHPEAYRALGYAALDSRRHRWLRLSGRIFDKLLEPMARLGDRFLAFPFLPYGIKSLGVRMVTGISYLVGTVRASSSG